MKIIIMLFLKDNNKDNVRKIYRGIYFYLNKYCFYLINNICSN